MMVHSLYHSAINRHAFRFIGLALWAQAVPVLGAGHSNHGAVRRHYAQFDCPHQTLLSQSLPAAVIHTHIAVNKFLRCLHGNMHGLKRHVGKKWLPIPLITVDKLDGLVD